MRIITLALPWEVPPCWIFQMGNTISAKMKFLRNTYQPREMGSQLEASHAKAFDCGLVAALSIVMISLGAHKFGLGQNALSPVDEALSRPRRRDDMPCNPTCAVQALWTLPMLRVDCSSKSAWQVTSRFASPCLPPLREAEHLSTITEPCGFLVAVNPCSLYPALHWAWG